MQPINYKRLLIIAVITSLSGSALIGILTFLFGQFNDFEWKIIGTSFFVGLYSLSALACVALLEKNNNFKPLAVAGILLTAISFTVNELLLWEAFESFSDVDEPIFSLFTLTFASAHAALVLLVTPKNNIVRTIQYTTLVAISIVALILLILIFNNNSYNQPEGLLRILGTAAIISATGTILGPVVNRLGPNKSVTEEEFLGTAVEKSSGKKFKVFKTADTGKDQQEMYLEELI